VSGTVSNIPSSANIPQRSCLFSCDSRDDIRRRRGGWMCLNYISGGVYIIYGVWINIHFIIVVYFLKTYQNYLLRYLLRYLRIFW
jgi:hypothetical protein